MSDVEVLRRLIGHRLGPSGWLTIDQTRIDAFSEATGNHQWIHDDPVRSATGPYGTTIAQGYLLMSLMVPLAAEIELPISARTTLNYGLDRLRFPAPVRVGSMVRAWVEPRSVDEISGGVQITRRVTIEIDGTDKPGLVAESVSRLLW